MKLFFVLLFTVACNFYFEAATKETLEIFDIISSLEYSHTYPLTYKDVEPVTGDTTCLIISDGAEFLATPQNQRFWIRDLKTGKYWKKDNHDFDLNFGLFSACNRRISHGRTYIIVIYKGVITVYDWHDSMVFVSIDKILKELKYSPLDRLKTLENVLNAKISTHIFEQPLIQKKINLR